MLSSIEASLKSRIDAATLAVLWYINSLMLLSTPVSPVFATNIVLVKLARAIFLIAPLAVLLLIVGRFA